MRMDRRNGGTRCYFGYITARGLKMRLWFLGILVAFLLTPVIFGATSRGVGGSREGALQDALRNAVQQEIGVEIGSSTLTQNFMVVRDQILSKTKGYVSQYKVLEEKQVFGSWEVLVDAQVSQAKLRDDLLAQKLLYAVKNKPRILVLLDERMENQPSFEKTATFKIEETLLAKGFKVVEAEQLEELRKAEAGKTRSAEELAKIGFKLGADLILRGTVSTAKASERMVYGIQMYNVPVQINARVVRTDNAEIVASATNRVQKNSRDAFSAAQFGLEQGGIELGNVLVQKVFDVWQSEVYNTSSVTLEVLTSGVELRRALEEKLLASGVIKDFNLRYLDGTNAVYDLDIVGSIHQIREMIESQKTGYYLQGMSANRIQIAPAKPAVEVSYDLNAPDLEITSFKIAEIFPSRARWYANQALAEVEMECRNAGAEQLKVSVFIPEIMGLASEERLSAMLPGDRKVMKLKLVLDAKKLSEWKQTQDVYGQVKVSMRVNGKLQERTLNAPVKIYGRNTMDWAQTASIATFATYDHPVVMELSRQVLKMVPPSDFNADVRQASAIFEAMSSAGIRYVKDPAGSPGNRTLDRVQFPWETIHSRSGDCDDLAVAFASLVASLGSEVAIISYPDHVLAMVNTGLSPKNWPALTGAKEQLIPYDGTLWIPVETTMMGKGFADAWSVASMEYQKAISQNQPIEVVILKEAWKTWPPFPAPLSEKAKWSVDEKRILSSLQDLESSRTKALAQKMGELRKSALQNPSIANELGVLEAYSGQYAEAEKTFVKVSEKSWKVKNNLAMAYLLQGKESEALALLKSISDQAPEVEVNLAICEYLMATDEAGLDRFVASLKKARAKLGSDEGLEQALGIDLGAKGGIRGAESKGKSAPKQINRRELRELIRSRVLAADTVAAKVGTGKTGSASRNTVPFGGVRGADPEQVSQVVNLIYWYETL